MAEKMYTSGEYLEKNPTWHAEHSPWKAKHIIRIMERNNIKPKTICEVGCGAGEILKQLQGNMSKECMFCGYDISPHAVELCKQKANERLGFEQKDILQERDAFFDLILLIDLIEHIEDYFGFLRGIKTKSRYKILHIPLSLSVQLVLRCSPIMQTRRSAGHIHYFMKETALQSLKDVGYEILDYFYTGEAMDLPTKSIKRRLARLPRRLFYVLNKDLTVRILGGYSLMVLVK